MFSSVQVGVEAHGGGSGSFLVWPVDHALVNMQTGRALTTAAEGDAAEAISPVYAGQRGHPVLLAGSVRDRILAAGPDATLRDVLADTRRLDVEVEDALVVRDADTPEEWGEALGLWEGLAG